VFAQFDTEASGYLTAAQFRWCLQATSLSLTPKQVTALMNVADLDGDGLIDYAEFSRFAYDVLLAVARESTLQQLQA
jgi:calmodulin